jgi:hypothetical protein
LKKIFKFINALVLFYVFLLNSAHSADKITDNRYASSECQISKEFVLDCDYRYSKSLDIKNLRLKINDKELEIKPSNIKPFPATKEQTSAILILADVSDPNRKKTVETKYHRTIGEILRNVKPHNKVGIAEFDSNLRVDAPIGADINALQKASVGLKATGLATEFYKNVLAAIDLLDKSNATRKGLIILSDGKDEDRAYRFEDVIKVAKSSNVSIMSFGYLEKPQDSPFLQSLKRLSDETYGLYFDLTDEPLPSVLQVSPFAFIETGGRLSIEIPANYDSQKINIILGKSNNEQLELLSEVVPNDEREFSQKIVEYVKKNWILVSVSSFAALVLLVLIIYIVIRIRRRRKPTLFASLIELNGSSVKYQIFKQAVRIGRGKDNDIRLANDSVSMHHAEVHRRREGDFYIVDLASTNGLLVNENKVHQEELHDGDVIELGEVRLRFVIEK